MGESSTRQLGAAAATLAAAAVGVGLGYLLARSGDRPSLRDIASPYPAEDEPAWLTEAAAAQQQAVGSSSAAAAAPSGTLFAHAVSTCSRRVLCVLEEAGVDFAFRPVNLLLGEQRRADHLARHPFGKVPAWQGADGLALFESRAIMRHVAEGSALVPSGRAERALMEQWISIEQSYLSPAVLPIYLMRVLKKVPLDEAAASSRRAELAPTLDLMEKRLAGSAHLAGPSFSLADLTCLCLFEVFEACGLRAELEERPALAAWWARCRARPTWSRVLARGAAPAKATG
jgi:glutathione S-transferase